MAVAPFFERVARRVADADSLLCVGLDPDPEKLPAPFADVPFAEGARDFCKAAIDATAADAAAFKPNAAFFEAAGAEGWAALRDVIAHAKRHAPVILDAKRGDIGNTGRAYARAVFGALDADAVTVSPYMGADSVEPFLADPARGAFVLCRTSNPGSKDFQEQPLADGAPLWEHVARKVRLWHEVHGNAGLVVGATSPDALAGVRAVVGPEPWFLVPGVGAQGGSPEAAVREGGPHVLVNASRAVLYAGDASSDAQARAAAALKDALNAHR